MKPISSNRHALTRFFAGLALATGAHAGIIQVDNNAQRPSPGAGWNEFVSPPASASSVVDSNGQTVAGVAVTYSGWSDSSNTGSHNGAFATTAWDPASDDYFFVADDGSATIVISGLVDSKLYDIQIIGSANSAGTGRGGDYTVNGSFGNGSSPANGDDYDAFLDGFGSGVVMTWTEVAPVSGEITIQLQNYAGSNSSHLNAFTIEGDFAVASQAIYQESFSGTGDLNGTAPDVRPGSETWSAAVGGWQDDGSIFGSTSSQDDYGAFLPFSPESGKIYTLTATVTQPTGGASPNSWVALGFAGTNTVLGPSTNGSNGSFWQNETAPWMLYRGSGNLVSFEGPGVNGSSTDATVSGTRTLSVVLDTTGSQWTAEWFNGASSLNTHPYATNPGVNYIGFGREDGVDVSIIDFRLKVSVESAPVITDIEVTSEGDVVLTTDVPASGVITKKADSPEGPFSEVPSTETGGNQRTIDSTNVDLNADGKEFYVVE